MVFCHSCGQGVEADWNACPFCSSPLIAPTPEVEVESPVYPSPVQNYDEYESPVENYDEYESPVQPSTEYGHGMSQPEYAAHDDPRIQPYQVPQTPTPQIQVPQYHQTPQTQYLTTQRGGGGGGKVVIIIAVVIGVMVLLSILLYAWASALAGKDTWSGSVDTRIPDVKWYDYDDTGKCGVQMVKLPARTRKTNLLTMTHWRHIVVMDIALTQLKTGIWKATTMMLPWNQEKL